MMRQRLVGTLVLLCGGVILWSLLFTGPAEYKLDRSTQLPPEPRIEVPQITEPAEPVGVPSAAAPIVSPQPVIQPAEPETPPSEPSKTLASEGGRFNGEGVKAAAAPPQREPSSAAKAKPANNSKPVEKVKTAPPAEPSKEARGLPAAWVIQCASFSQPANANKMVERLRAGGYKAYSESLQRGDKTLYRVLVGPALNRERAESLQAEINRRFGLKSILSRFEG